VTETRPTSRLRPFILCADDYALTEGVSRGILRLASQGRISATGVMANRPHWPRLAPELRALDGQVAIGLHLNLTLGPPLAPLAKLAPGGQLPGFGRLARLGLAGQLPAEEIAGEIASQLDAFAQAMGRLPDFVDGHQHVHVLRGVRGPLLSVLAAKGLARHGWIRDPAERPAAIRRRRVAVPKALVIAGLAAGFGRAAHRAGFTTNAGFAGVSPFDPGRDFGSDFARFLLAPGARHLVMCHPGEIDDELRRIDPVVETRKRELDFFASERFGEACAAAGMRMAPSWPRDHR